MLVLLRPCNLALLLLVFVALGLIVVRHQLIVRRQQSERFEARYAPAQSAARDLQANPMLARAYHVDQLVQKWDTVFPALRAKCLAQSTRSFLGREGKVKWTPSDPKSVPWIVTRLIRAEVKKQCFEEFADSHDIILMRISAADAGVDIGSRENNAKNDAKNNDNDNVNNNTDTGRIVRWRVTCDLCMHADGKSHASCFSVSSRVQVHPELRVLSICEMANAGVVSEAELPTK